MGNASGNSVPLIFLADGKKLESKAIKNLDRKGRLTGSTVIMTPRYYMTNVAWIQLAPIVCKGVCYMTVIFDHPDWWVMLSLDGYYIHINVHELLKVFAEYKIFVVKEEGDTSQVKQAYNQAVAISYKHAI